MDDERRSALRLRVLRLILLLVLAAVAAYGLIRDDPGPVVRDGPLLVRNDVDDFGMLAQVSGTFVIRAECSYLRGRGGDEYLVVLPRGARWDPERDLAVTKAGKTLASGQQIAGGGGYLMATDATKAMAGVRQAAEGCDYEGEVAVYNSGSGLEVN